MVSGNDLLEDKINAKFLQDYIDGIVEQLPEKSRLVYNYSRKKGLSNAEIAREMRISQKTVEGHLTKVLKTLRLSVKEQGLLFIVLLKLLPK